MNDFRKDVTAQTTVVDGMTAYIAGIQKRVVDVANASEDDKTKSALMALASQIDSNAKADAEAVAANLTGITPAQAGTEQPKPVEKPVVAEAPAKKHVHAR